MTKNNKRLKKQVKTLHKRFSAGALISIILCFILGAMVGIGAEKLVTKNDTFELKGNVEYKYNVGDDIFYQEEGYKVISFGKDLTEKVKITTNLKTDEDGNYYCSNAEAGEYYIIYTVDSKKYGKVQKFRTFTVEDSNE